MGTCAANGPVKWESCCWLFRKASRYSCRLLLTNRSFRFLACLKAFRGVFFENFAGGAVVAKDPEVP